MPARKSNDAPRQSNGGADEDPPAKSDRHHGTLNVEELTLPRSMIARLAKGVLPANTQIQKDALLAMSKSATVFVNYLASNANDRAVLANKKTIRQEDVLEALTELEFDSFLPRCSAELTRYNTIQCDKRNSYRRRVKDEKGAALKDAAEAAGAANGTGSSTKSSPGATSPGLVMLNGNDNGNGAHHNSPPAAKKARTSLAGGVANGVNGTSDDDTVEEIEGDEQEEEQELSELDEDEEPNEGFSEPDEASGAALEEDRLAGEEERLRLEDEDEEEESESD